VVTTDKHGDRPPPRDFGPRNSSHPGYAWGAFPIPVRFVRFGGGRASLEICGAAETADHALGGLFWPQAPSGPFWSTGS
jgi:hypothetical protein